MDVPLKGECLKNIQPKTLQIMVTTLTYPAFSQNMLWRIINRSHKISLGHVNKVIMDLERQKFVEPLFRQKRLGDLILQESGSLWIQKGNEDERVRYRLADPIGLLRYIYLFRSMKALRVFSAKVNAPIETIINRLEHEGVIFCLGTAQSRYSPYFRPDRVSFYSNDPERIYKNVNNEAYGNSYVDCYRIDYIRKLDDTALLIDDIFASKEGPLLLTTKVQTVLDMFCDGKGVYAKPLIKELWGLEI